jgi:nucleoside-diphosphate-sugar epimerase
MRILLTGSSGWLGRYLAPRLRTGGHEVTGLDIAPGADTDVVGSVADRSVIDEVFGGRNIEAVIHAGALHKPDIVRYPAQAFIDVNVTGTLNLLEAATAVGVDRFVFTSSTSLMISAAIRSVNATAAAWLTEDAAPLAPRNIYGVTKLTAEHLCRLHHDQHGLNVVVLRTGRFFPEEDDELVGDGLNVKANEFMHRRLTVEDAAQAHIAALERAPQLGFETFIVSALTPFVRADAAALIADAPSVVARYFPQAPALYAARGWQLPSRIDRVYDATKAQRLLGFQCQTDFATILEALDQGLEPPVIHDPDYISPKEPRTGWVIPKPA